MKKTKQGNERRTKTGIMFYRNRSMPLKLIEREPEGVEPDGSGRVDRGGPDEERQGKFKIIAVHHRLRDSE